MNTTRTLTASFSLLLALAGCSGDSRDGAASSSGSESGSPGAVAATVNDEVIAVEDVKKVAHNFTLQNIQPDPAAEGDTFESRLYYTVVNRLVEQALILQEVKNRGIEITEDQVQAGVSQLKVMAGGDEAFRNVLAENGISLEDVVRDTRTNLAVREFYNSVVTEPPAVAEADIQAFYDQNTDEYASQPEVRARHILIRTQPGMDEMQRAEARNRASQLLAQAGGDADFAELARTHSEDETTAPNGGDLSWFRQGRMVAPFDSASFALKPGQVSGLVETQFGYHIIKVEETRMSPRVTLEEARPNITSLVQQQKAQELFEAAVTDLRAEAQVDIRPPSPAVLAEIGS
jgi:peptidyl-prolyl cis-trans isomerase C